MQEPVKLPQKRISEYIDGLRLIYAEMDKKYKKAADNYGFNCTGCDQNCCMTHFHHHTYIEYIYILEGMRTLAPGRRTEVKRRAGDAIEREKPVKQMCALNADGLCILYDYRPMICRMHGIPSELNTPGQGASYGPGCDTFTLHFGEKKYYQFDRTPFYNKIARLENELKQELGTVQKFKKTIAEMLAG